MAAAATASQVEKPVVIERKQAPHEALKDRIPVRVIQAPAGGQFNVPGKITGSSVTSKPERPAHQDHHFIEFVPAMRSFAVTYWDANNKIEHLRYIHETNVGQWEPLL